MFTTDFLEKNGVLTTWLVSTSLIFLRYVFFAGTAFLLFYKFKVTHFLSKKIQQCAPKRHHVRIEIVNSIISVIVFGLFAVLILVWRRNGHTLIYVDLTKYGYGYLLFSFIAIILLHDAYFYWLHRLLHRPTWFQQIHSLHHHSHNPTPWASFSFHPLEAILEFAILPIAVFIIPLHPLVLLAWSLWMIAWNVLGHLGYEIFPRAFSKSRWFTWVNSSTHHNLHHSRSKGNYGLYFNFWDRWMRTNDNGYRQAFENIFER